MGAPHSLSSRIPRRRPPAGIGKAEGKRRQWHGHVSVLTVTPEFRRMGLARTCMSELERVSDRTYKAYFVDLFVRCSNTVAIRMYAKLGYRVYRCGWVAWWTARQSLARVFLPYRCSFAHKHASYDLSRANALHGRPPRAGACWATTPGPKTPSTCE